MMTALAKSSQLLRLDLKVDQVVAEHVGAKFEPVREPLEGDGDAVGAELGLDEDGYIRR